MRPVIICSVIPQSFSLEAQHIESFKNLYGSNDALVQQMNNWQNQRIEEDKIFQQSLQKYREDSLKLIEMQKSNLNESRKVYCESESNYDGTISTICRER